MRENGSGREKIKREKRMKDKKSGILEGGRKRMRKGKIS